MYGICNLSAVPVRAEPSDRSEMVSQLLFGDHFAIIEYHTKWVKIKQAYDDYSGWISDKQYHKITSEEFNKMEQLHPLTLVGDIAQIVKMNEGNDIIPVLMGSTLPGFKAGRFNLGELKGLYQGTTHTPNKNNLRKQLIETAYLYLHSPYLWGGKSPFGIDCSGFTQMVFKFCGIRIMRDASQQVNHGISLNFIEEAKPGDLAFFDREDGKIIHVGILLSDQEIIHASGCVRIDKIDHMGIFNEQTGKYTHNLRIIKNLL